MYKEDSCLGYHGELGGNSTLFSLTFRKVLLADVQVFFFTCALPSEYLPNVASACTLSNFISYVRSRPWKTFSSQF